MILHGHVLAHSDSAYLIPYTKEGEETHSSLITAVVQKRLKVPTLLKDCSVPRPVHVSCQAGKTWDLHSYVSVPHVSSQLQRSGGMVHVL